MNYKKFDESGFGSIGIISILIIILLIGSIGYSVWHFQKRNNEDSPNPKNQSITVAPKKQETNPNTTKVKSSIINGTYVLYTSSDVAKLPSSTPASFKSFIAGRLIHNDPNEYGCIDRYTITRVSTANITGEIATVKQPVSSYSQNDGSCEGGAKRIWAIASQGIWDETGVGELPECTTKNGGKIYVEFSDQCFTGIKIIANPNGSVDSLTI